MKKCKNYLFSQSKSVYEKDYNHFYNVKTLDNNKNYINQDYNDNDNITSNSSVSSSLDQQNFFKNCYEAQKIYSIQDTNDAYLKKIQRFNTYNNYEEIKKNEKKNDEKKNQHQKKKGSKKIDYKEIKNVINRLNSFINQYSLLTYNKNAHDNKNNRFEPKHNKTNPRPKNKAENENIYIKSESNVYIPTSKSNTIKQFNFTEADLDNYNQILPSIFHFLSVLIKRNVLNNIISYSDKKYRYTMGFENLIFLFKHDIFNILRLLQQREYYQIILKLFYLPLLSRAFYTIKEYADRTGTKELSNNDIYKGKNDAFRKKFDDKKNEASDNYNDESVVDDINILDMVFGNLNLLVENLLARWAFYKIFMFAMSRTTINTHNDISDYTYNQNSENSVKTNIKKSMGNKINRIKYKLTEQELNKKIEEIPEEKDEFTESARLEEKNSNSFTPDNLKYQYNNN